MKLIFQLSKESLIISKTLDNTVFECVFLINCELGSGVLEGQKIDQKTEVEQSNSSQKNIKKRLDLADRVDLDLEAIWKLIYPKYILEAQQLELNISNQASFTDTRLLAIWIRSEVFFNPTKTFEIYKNSVLESSSAIPYMREPSIN